MPYLLQNPKNETFVLIIFTQPKILDDTVFRAQPTYHT